MIKQHQPLLRLPTELRIFIYKNIREKPLSKLYRIDSSILIKTVPWDLLALRDYISENHKTMVALIRTCRQIHDEITLQLCPDQNHIITVSNNLDNKVPIVRRGAAALFMLECQPDLNFLAKPQKVKPYVNVDLDRNFGNLSAALRDTLARLTASGELTNFMLEVNFRSFNGRQEEKFNARAKACLSLATLKARREGRSVMEREFNFGWRVAETLE